MRCSFLKATLLVLIMLSGVCSCQPVLTIESPLVSPLLTPVNTVHNIPTPLPERGVVAGVLVHHVFGNPLDGRILYLAPVLQSNDSRMEMVRLDIATAPKTQTDEAGRFIFVDIPPGRYGIVLSGVVNDYLLADFRSEEEIIFTVEAGQIVDLGEIWIVPPEE